MPLKCDLCNADNPTWRYCAKSFLAGNLSELIGQSSIGDWAACDTCQKLIEAGDIQGLAARSTAKQIEETPQLAIIAAGLLDEVTILFKRFFANRCGEAIPSSATEPDQPSAIIYLASQEEAQAAVDLANSGLPLAQVKQLMEAANSSDSVN